MEPKNALLSKTVWVNAIVALCGILASFGLIPSVNEWMASHVDFLMSGLGVVGIILRAISKDKIVLGA